MDLTFPVEQDLEPEEKDGSTKSKFKRDPRRFSMQPYKNGEKGDNHLLFLPFALNSFGIFKHWPEATSFYAKFFVHFIQLPNEETGDLERRMVICEKRMNKYANEMSNPGATFPKVFESSECAFCERANGFWEEYAEAKKAKGIDGLTTEQFKEVMNKNPEIRAIKDNAVNWGPKDRYYFVVYDYAKITGEKALDPEDDGQVRLQGYWGPETIVSSLYKKKRAGYQFWDIAGGKGRVVVVNRDNSASARFCEYSLEVMNDAPQLSGDVIAYLEQGEDLPDPTNDVLIWSPKQKRDYVTVFGGGATREAESAPAPEPERKTSAAPTPLAPPSAPTASEPVTAEGYKSNESAGEPEATIGDSPLPTRPRVWR